MCHIGTLSTRYCMRTAEKVWRSKVKKKLGFAECQKITLGKGASLPSATCLPSSFSLALGKYPLCRVLSLWHSANRLFAECQMFAEFFLSGTR